MKANKVQERLKAKLLEKRSKEAMAKLSNQQLEGRSLGEKSIKAYGERNYQKAIEYGKKALSLLESEVMAGDKANVLWSLGAAYHDKSDFETAVDYYQQTEKYYSFLTENKLQDLFERQFECYLYSFNFEEAFKIAEKIKGTYGKIMKLQAEMNYEKIPLEELYQESQNLKPSNKKELIVLMSTRAMICAKLGKLDEMIDYGNTIFKIVENSRIENIMFQIINCARNAGKFKEALDFFNSMQKFCPPINNNDFLVLYNLFIVL